MAALELCFIFVFYAYYTTIILYYVYVLLLSYQTLCVHVRGDKIQNLFYELPTRKKIRYSFIYNINLDSKIVVYIKKKKKTKQKVNTYLKIPS